MENEKTKVKAKRILAIFPKDYTLRESYERVLSWNPDTDSLKWGLINGVPYVYAEKQSKFEFRTKVLQSEGIDILSGDRLQRIPTLDSPALYQPSQSVENRLPVVLPGGSIQEERINDLERMLEQAMETIQVQRRELSQEREKNQIQEGEIDQLKNRVLILEKELAAIKTRSASVIDRALSPIPSRAVSPQVSPQVVKTQLSKGVSRETRAVSPQVAPIPARVASPERPRVEVPQVGYRSSDVDRY
jgi:hypothetical protein